MRKYVFFLSLLALAVAISAGLLAPAAADFFGCNDKSGHVGAACNGKAGSTRYSHEFSAQSRPRVTIHPRHRLTRYSKRHCRAWLAREYRISGPVIVPQQRCWWD